MAQRRDLVTCSSIIPEQLQARLLASETMLISSQGGRDQGTLNPPVIPSIHYLEVSHYHWTGHHHRLQWASKLISGPATQTGYQLCTDLVPNLDQVIFGRACAKTIAADSPGAPIGELLTMLARLVANIDKMRFADGDINTSVIRLKMQKTMQTHAAVFRTGMLWGGLLRRR